MSICLFSKDYEHFCYLIVVFAKQTRKQMKKNIKFLVMLVLLIGASSQIKAQKGEPFRNRKADDSPYTKEEQKAYYSRVGEFYDSMRNERVRLINLLMQKHGEKLRVTTKNIGWTIDQTHWVEKKEFSAKVINEYRVGSKIMRDVIAQKTTGYYSVFSYNGWSEIIDDPSCMNLQIVVEEKKTGKTEEKENISETPEVAKTETDETQTTITSEEPCYKEVWKTQQYWAVEKVMYRPENAAGWYTGYYGMDNGYQSYNRRVLKTRKVKVLVPCEETAEVEDEELPVASRDSETDEETTERVRTKRPVYIFLNGSFVFYRNAARMSGGTVLNPGGPVHTGGLGGPVHTGGAVGGGPVYNGGLH